MTPMMGAAAAAASGFNASGPSSGSKTPLPDNHMAAGVDGVIHVLIFDVAEKAAETYARAQVPFLNTPVISQIFSYAMKWLCGFVYVAMSNQATFTVIDLQTDHEKDQYIKAVDELKAIQKSGDQNAIDEAKRKFREKLAALIKFDGSHHTQ